MVCSYECNVELDIHHLQNLLSVLRRSNSLVYYITLRLLTGIIDGLRSNIRMWSCYFFYVREDDKFVEEGHLPFFREMWGKLSYPDCSVFM